MTVHITIASTVDDELVTAFERLIPQLSSSNPPPTASELTDLVSSDASTLFIARVNGQIVGSLTLAMFRIPTGIRAWIEDVVVDSNARGHGVGEALNMAALEYAKKTVEYNPDYFDGWRALYAVTNSTAADKQSAKENMIRLDPLNNEWKNLP